MSIGVWTWPGDTLLTVMPVRPERAREPAAHADVTPPLVAA